LEGNLGWSQFYTYVLGNQGLSPEKIESKFKKLLEKLYGKESHISIFLQPLEDIYLTSHLREEIGESGSAQQLIFLTIIAYTILMMAWINYINMFLAKSMERANEIGVKKVLGSTRIHLTIQFFTESLVINVISFSVALILWLLLQQSFESWVGKDVSQVLLAEIPFIAIILVAVFVGSMLAGLYPALILSSLRIGHVLGRSFQTQNQGIFFNQGLVYFQFIVSFIILASTLIIHRQINFMTNADLGMELSGCVAIRSPANVDSTYQQRLQSYKERLLTYPFITNVSSTSSIPSRSIRTSGGVERVIGPELEGNNVFFFQVDENFLKTYAIRLIGGKNFPNKDSGIPSIILNEAALETLKFESPEEALNHRIHWQRREFEVIGVFANYNHLFLKETFEPIMLSFNPSATGFITLKVQQGYYEQALAVANDEMQSLFPSTPFEYNFLESTYNHQYRSVQQFELLANYFSLLAIVIACLGLFALSYYSVQRKINEIAVRKVFGAGMLDVLLLLSKKYFGIAILSCLVGSLITFYVMDEWLQNFAFAIRLGIPDFLIPLSAITIIVVLTVSYNCLKTSLINPSQSLKHH
jgi:putative ABC transport system permease protein